MNNQEAQDKFSLLPRPITNNPDMWCEYWQAHNQPWRTEQEISQARQEELAKRRATPVNVENGSYPFRGVKLTRADVEWLLSTHDEGQGPVVWNDKERYRNGLDLRGADLSGNDKQRINLSGLPLTNLNTRYHDRASQSSTKEQSMLAIMDMKGVDLSGTHLEGAYLNEAQLEEAIFIEAHLEGTFLFGAQLKKANFRAARLMNADLNNAHLEDANFSGAHLEGAGFGSAHLQGASFMGAHLQRAILSVANLEDASFIGAQLEGAYLMEARLERVDLSVSHLEGANLSRAQLEGVKLGNTTLGDQKGIGPQLVDVQWGSTNLALMDWSQIVQLGDEYVASQKKNVNGKIKDRDALLAGYQEAVRANRQLAVALQGQGLNEDAFRFAYRANLLQRKVLWYQIFEKQQVVKEEGGRHWLSVFGQTLAKLWKPIQKLRSYLFSLFLDVLAGYGYNPVRTLGWYFFVVLGFALLYTLLGHLAWYPDALVYSLTSFHGRGFLPNLDGQTITLHTPLVVMAAFEAVIGLLIELSFIATFTQRFFGK